MGKLQQNLRLCAVLLCLHIPVAAAAQYFRTADQLLSVATIDQDKLFSDSLFGKAYNKNFIKNTNTLAEENRRIEKELTDEETELTEKRKTLSNDAFRKLAATFNDKVETIRRDQSQKLKNLNASRVQAQLAFFVKAKPIIIDLMNERGIMFILNKQAVFMSGSSGDITDSAIERIDQVLEADLLPKQE